MFYSWICSCNILGVEGWGIKGRGPKIRTEGRGSRNTDTLLFCSSIDLFDFKDFKKKLTDGNLIRKCVWREFYVAIFMITGILIGKSFWVVNTWRAPVRKWLKRSPLNFAHTFLTDCCTKSCPCFPNNELFIFIAKTRRPLKAYFAWKQLKADYSKNIWKKENRGTVLFFSWLATHQWKKVLGNCNSVDAGA